MKKGTLLAIVVVVLVAVVLVSGMGLFPSNNGNGAKDKTATMTINFSDASTSQFRNNVTTWTNTSGTWSYETHESGDGTTIFTFKNMSFSGTVLDVLNECSKVGDFPITRQSYVAMGSIVHSIDGVANENPGRGWQYYVDGTYALIASDKTVLKGGEVVDWKFITLQGQLK